MIIADEGHKLRNKDTARTRRFLRYLAQHNARFFAWSGTLFGSSVKHAAHLSAFALREGSPFPLDPDVVDEWSAAIDPSDNPHRSARSSDCLRPQVSEIERALHVRIVESPGVVSTKEVRSMPRSSSTRELLPSRRASTKRSRTCGKPG